MYAELSMTGLARQIEVYAGFLEPTYHVTS
jgi:hypothetical protein